MIKEITITNFYSFKDATIKLRPNVNILVGINGSGKSNFLKALRFLKEGVGGGGLRKHIFDNLGGFANFYFKGAKDSRRLNIIQLIYKFEGIPSSFASRSITTTEPIYEISIQGSPSLSNYSVDELIKNKNFIELETRSGRVEFQDNKNRSRRSDTQELVLNGISELEENLKNLSSLKKAIKEIVVYDYFDTSPQSRMRKPMLPTSERRLSADGTNLPQILNTIKINHKQYYRKIVEMLKEVNPNFTGFDFNLIGGNIELMLEESSFNSSIHVSNISDGTLRYLCLLAIVYNPDRGRIVCIDEPEVGLHPDMILNIANAIKEASETSMFIISTHSENFLNYFDIEDVHVFEKDENNATQVVSYDREQFAGWYKEFSLGQMWRQGDLGGVRYGS